MEFVCVLSINGSLLSYHVSQLSETQYKALLRSGGEKRKEIPETIYLERIEKNWEVNPWHRETAEAIIHAIEAGA